MKNTWLCQFDTTGEIPKDLKCSSGCSCKRPEITADNPGGIFWCERANNGKGRRKTARQWVKCQTEPASFLRYLHGPPPPAASLKPRNTGKGLGDRVGQALTLVGVTSERVESWLGRKCGCARRKQRLNELGAWAHRVIAGKTANAKEYLEELIGNPEEKIEGQ